MQPERQRPVYLNLFQITLPPGGWVSIMHRVSGVFLILVTPFLLYYFGDSMRSEQGFQRAVSLINSFSVKLLVWAISVALLHHLLAGIRHLLLDLKIGISRPCGRMSAYAVMAVDSIGALLIGWLLW